MSKIKLFSLGGLNELGNNMYVANIDDEIFILDAGFKLADDKMLGIDYIIPNYDYLKENKEKIRGIFISHGHDSQYGALPDILVELPDLEIYGTNFTINIIKNVLEEQGIMNARLNIIEPHKVINFKNASIFPISLTHSVPGSVGYVINTKDGSIVYTSNFVFDPTMYGAYKTDIGKLAYVGKLGVLCLMSESLYADKKGYTSPNNRIEPIVLEILNRAEGRVLFNIFEAQLYRIQELFNGASLTDRKVVVLGKRLENIINYAIDLKYIDFDKSKLLGLNHVNDQNVIILISDDREKPFSNISRIIKGHDKFIKTNEDDTIVFASPTYDGLEKRATKIYDEIAKLDLNLKIIPKKYLSNHASSEDLMMMINLMNPKYYFPVIGEYRHQVANADAANKIGMNANNILLKLNGEVVEFINGKLTENNEKIKVDEILVDGKTAGDIGELVIKDREMLSDSGIVIVSATLDRNTKKMISGPEVLTRGFIFVKDNIDVIKEAQKLSFDVIKENTNSYYVDFNKIKLGIRDKLGKYFYKETECKPMILVVMQEV